MEKVKRKSRKVMEDLYSEKYGKTKEEINRILTEDEGFLDKNELAIKYDNLDIGKLPKWLTEKEFRETVTKATNFMWRNYTSFWVNWIEYRELWDELYIYGLEKAMLFDNVKHLSTALVNNGRRILQYRYNRLILHPKIGLDTLLSVTKYRNHQDDDSECTPMDRYMSDLYSPKRQLDDSQNNKQLIDTILQIKDKQVREILIVVGYLLANIPQLKPYFEYIVKNADEKLKENLLKLQNDVEPECDVEVITIPVTSRSKTTYEQKEVREYKQKQRSPSFRTIVRVMTEGVNDIVNNENKLTKRDKLDQTIKDIQYYIKEACIFNV